MKISSHKKEGLGNKGQCQAMCVSQKPKAAENSKGVAQYTSATNTKSWRLHVWLGHWATSWGSSSSSFAAAAAMLHNPQHTHTSFGLLATQRKTNQIKLTWVVRTFLFPRIAFRVLLDCYSDTRRDTMHYIILLDAFTGASVIRLFQEQEWMWI